MSITNAKKQERDASRKFSAHEHFKLIKHIFKKPLKFKWFSMTFLASFLKKGTSVMENLGNEYTEGMERKGSVFNWMTRKEQKYNITIAILKHFWISHMAEIKALNRHQLTIDITKLKSIPSSNKVREYVTHYL